MGPPMDGITMLIGGKSSLLVQRPMVPYDCICTIGQMCSIDMRWKGSRPNFQENTFLFVDDDVTTNMTAGSFHPHPRVTICMVPTTTCAGPPAHRLHRAARQMIRQTLRWLRSQNLSMDVS